MDQKRQIKAVRIFQADLYAAVPNGLRHPIPELTEICKVYLLVFFIDIHPLCRQRAVYAPEHMHVQCRDSQLFGKLHRAQHIFHIGAPYPRVQAAGVQFLIQMDGIEDAVLLFYPKKLLCIQILQLVLREAHVQLDELQAQPPAQCGTVLKVFQFDQGGHSKGDHIGTSAIVVNSGEVSCYQKFMPLSTTRR